MWLLNVIAVIGIFGIVIWSIWNHIQKKRGN